jgi:FkbM family methyltransferase
MGLFRYLRSKLNIQQLKETSDALSSKTELAIAGQQQLKEKTEQAIAGLQQLDVKTGRTIAGQQQLKEISEEVSSKADLLIFGQHDLRNQASLALSGQHELGNKADRILSLQREIEAKSVSSSQAQQQLEEREREISAKTDQVIAKQYELCEKTDRTIALQQHIQDLADETSSKSNQALLAQQRLREEFSVTAANVEQVLKACQPLKEAVAAVSLKTEESAAGQDKLSQKADQAIAGHQHLHEEIGGTAAKVDQVLKAHDELKKAVGLLSSKAEESAAGQEKLVQKADQAIAGQQELHEEISGTASKVDQALKAHAKLKGAVDGLSLKAGESAAGQEKLAQKADQAIAGQHELVQKTDQLISVYQQLQATEAGTQEKLDQFSVSQKKCGNETEFARMSRTMFASFRYWEDNFYNAVKGIDIEERYDRLTSGLSDEDRTLVDTMIGRIQHLCEKGDKTCYMPDEAERIYRNKKENLRIVKLNEHCFVYRNFKLPINAFETSTFVCNYGLDLIEHPEYTDGKDIIDAGAYIGDSALVFDRYFSKCRRIYAFEPDPSSYALMEKTIVMNKKSNIVPVRLGLGDANSDGKLTSHGMGANLLDRKFGQEEKDNRIISIVRLDDYVKQNNIVTGVIKTDLEGFEMYFLRGALETIKKDRPILVLSIYHSADDFFGIKPFIENLGLGYRFRLFKADDGMILGGTCLLCMPE